MPKDRKITRENRRKEQLLNGQNEFGNNDPTPYAAVKQIVRLERRVTRGA